MTSWVCAFCGPTDRKRTKEHLWPASLHRHVVALLDGGEQKFWVARLDKALSNEPTIRDVCAVCNNGELSKLDNYICEAFDRDFSVIRERGEKVSLSGTDVPLFTTMGQHYQHRRLLGNTQAWIALALGRSR